MGTLSAAGWVWSTGRCTASCCDAERQCGLDGAGGRAGKNSNHRDEPTVISAVDGCYSITPA